MLMCRHAKGNIYTKITKEKNLKRNNITAMARLEWHGDAGADGKSHKV